VRRLCREVDEWQPLPFMHRPRSQCRHTVCGVRRGVRMCVKGVLGCV